MTQNTNVVIAPDGFGYFPVPSKVYSIYDSKDDEYGLENRTGNGFTMYINNLDGNLKVAPRLTVDRNPLPTYEIFRKGRTRATFYRTFRFLALKRNQ